MTPEIEIVWYSQFDLRISIAYDAAKGLSFLKRNTLSGLSPSPFDFGSNVSLSTLHHFHYFQQCKTRYTVRLVPFTVTGLSPARYAPLILAPWLTISYNIGDVLAIIAQQMGTQSF